MMCSFLSYTACFFQLSVYHIWSHLSCFFFVNFGTCQIEKREYPPRMTPQMRKDVMRFEHLREQFQFLRDNGISTADDMSAYETMAEESLAGLIKQRTILNVRKKRRRKLYTALADVDALAAIRKFYTEGVPSLEGEAVRYAEAVAALERTGIDQNTLRQEKAGLYNQLAEVNREIRTVRKRLKMCAEIREKASKIEQDIRKPETVRQMKRQKQVR